MARTVSGGSNRPTVLWLFNILLILLTSCLCFAAYLLSSNDRPWRIGNRPFRMKNMTSQGEDIPGIIPKRLHQTYVSRYVPEAYAPFIKSWAMHHQHWEYWFWSNEDGLAFIRDKYPKYLKMYGSYSDDLQRSDALRYFILYHYGGVYADMDMEVYMPIDPLILNYTCFFSEEPPIETILLYNLSSVPMNALMGSIKHHDFFNYIIRNLPRQQRRSKSKYDATEITGPLMLQKAVLDYNTHKSNDNDIASIVPYTFFMPNIDRDQTHKFKSKNCKRKNMSQLEQKACHDFEAYLKLSPKQRLGNAYGDHKFLHLGYRKNMKDTKTVDVYSLISSVFRYPKVTPLVKKNGK